MCWGVGAGHLFAAILPKFLRTETQRLAPLLYHEDSNVNMSQKAQDTTPSLFKNSLLLIRKNQPCKLGFIPSIKSCLYINSQKKDLIFLIFYIFLISHRSVA